MTTRRLGPAHETSPFGPPDGARADLDEIERGFVDFSGQPQHDDLASEPGDRSVRLIVGKKGVGKTVYLRRFQADAHKERSVYADRVRHDVPATEDVIRVCELYGRELAAEGWQWIWRRAIMRSLASHVLCAPELRDGIDADSLALLEGRYATLLGEFSRPRGVYGEASHIASQVGDNDRKARERLNDELRHRDWDDIEDVLGEALLGLPPICFYLDSVDEQFGSAPLYWLQCQKGLCLQVLELYRDQRFGKLHVVVSVRDVVRSSLLRGEHLTRYTRARHIRVLDWDDLAIRHLLHEKIRRLRSELWLAGGDGVPGWLGRDTIYNHKRGVDEDVEDYLLRHTRQIPRDVIQLGNELCTEVARASAAGQRELGDDAIRRAVAVVSKELADEQLAVCANHLASDMTPSDAGRHDYADFYMSGYYTSGVQDELRAVVGAVGSDRFPMPTLRQALADCGGEVLGRHPNPLNVLWLNGLLGYDSPDARARSHFYGAHDIADFALPEGHDSYVFHPIVGHTVPIQAAGDRPVRPFR